MGGGGGGNSLVIHAGMLLLAELSCSFPILLHHVVTQVPQLHGLLAGEAQGAVSVVVGAAFLVESAAQIVLVGRRKQRFLILLGLEAPGALLAAFVGPVAVAVAVLGTLLVLVFGLLLLAVRLGVGPGPHLARDPP